jgi:hypothetical protein
MTISTYDPAAEYKRRRDTRSASLAEAKKMEGRIANLRLLVFLIAIPVVYGSLVREWFSPYWIAAPVAMFTGLVIAHAPTIKSIASLECAARYYENGIARVEGRWHGTGMTGEHLIPHDHPYAADLDVFGKDSLFALMCTTRTRAGAKTLASWLCTQPSAQTIRERQQAVSALREKIGLREYLWEGAKEVERGVLPEAMKKWATAPAVFTSNTERFQAWLLRAATIAALAFTVYFDWALPILVALALFEWWTGRRTRQRAAIVLKAIEEPQRELAALLHVLRHLEAEHFDSPALTGLQQKLFTGGVSASSAINRLYRLTAWHDARGNMLFAIFAALLLWDLNFAYAFEQWRLTYGRHLPDWLDAIGELEALCSIAGYAYEHPKDPFPEIVEHGPIFEAASLGHPLIPANACVRNDLTLDSPTRLIVVSGSNMSGKSTLLRMTGINALLAFAGAPVCARKLRISPLAIGATLRIQDSIQEGTSRFYAEVARVKQIVDLAGGPTPTLFLLDELFAGTNSHDRRKGAEAVLRGLLEAGAIGLITTHDLALTEVALTIGNTARNVHFQDHLENGKLAFDYIMRDGIVQKSNAIELMRSVGLKI